MRVLCLTNLYPTAERPAWGTFVRSQMESLRPLGVDFDVCLIRGWESRWNYWKQRADVRAALRRGYDLVHVHFGLTGAVLEGMRTPPTVLSLCGDDLLGRARTDGSIDPASRPMMWLSLRAARRAAVVIVKSRRMAERLAPVRESIVLPNGVDFGMFREIPKADARSILGWPAEEKIVLFAADPAIAAKNFALAEATVRELERGGVSVRLVALHGRPQEEVVAAMNAADALLFTSWWEGSPNVVKEAMVVGLPVVTVDVGDVRDYVEGVEGCRIVAADAAALAGALRPLVLEPSRTAGRTRMQPLSAERVARELHALYGRALASGGR